MTIEQRDYAALLIRATDEEKREVTGIAVPWGEVANIGNWYRESIARGAVQDSDGALLLWRHDEPIGKLVSHRDTDEGWEVTFRIAPTPRGDEVYTLVREGVIDRFSIGFYPVEHTEREGDDGVVEIIRTVINVREVSLVPFPAYDSATVTDVRHASAINDREKNPVNPKTETADVTLDDLRADLGDLQRQFAAGISTKPAERSLGDELATQFRSIGDYVKAVADTTDDRHDLAVRAYEGATTGDTVVKDAWIGELIELQQQRQRVLNRFQRGALPSEGNGVEYAVLDEDTTEVEQQVAEGDDLAFGKVSIKTETARIGTYGGWSSLSRQAIERSNVGVLDTTFTALNLKYARAIELLTRKVVTDQLAKPETAAIEGDLTTADGLIELVIDLVEHMDEAGRSLDGIMVASDVFKALATVREPDRRVLRVNGATREEIGGIDLGAIRADLAGISIELFPKAAPGLAFGFDRLAVKTLEQPGAPIRLQDENIVNLTKQFSVYGYAASFVQVPAGLVNITPAG